MAKQQNYSRILNASLKKSWDFNSYGKNAKPYHKSIRNHARNKSVMAGSLVNMLFDLDQRTQKIQSEKRIIMNKLLKTHREEQRKVNFEDLASYNSKQSKLLI